VLWEPPLLERLIDRQIRIGGVLLSPAVGPGGGSPDFASLLTVSVGIVLALRLIRAVVEKTR
jgi:hypothetical protein